jgi:N utilization substance protein B
MSGTRRLSRELAMQVLFQQEFSPQPTSEASLETFRKSFEASAEVWSYALQLMQGVNSHRPAIDALIQKCSAHWRLERMNLVDLNIMRMSAFELKFLPDDQLVPPAVVINEAIEIAKKYGTVDSAAFVNGILDQVVKQ